MKVNFINNSYRRFYRQHSKEINDAIKDCLKTGRLCLREDLWELEKNFAEFIGTGYAAGVNSGTDALFLSLKALGIGPGDEVITCSNTFVATIQAIVHCGATPILVDVLENEQMNVYQAEQAITSKTKAIIPIHYTGAMVDMDLLKAISLRHNIPIVEDACQAVGASWMGQRAGTWSALGCFSFNTAKLMGGITDGGMVVTDSRELYEKIVLLRNHWNVHQLSVNRKDYPQPEKMEWGWKSRLSNVNAAFLNVKMKYLPELLKRREEIAERYLNEIRPSPKFDHPHRQEGRVWQEYHLRVRNRDEFAKFMTKKGIETLTRDAVPNHKMSGYEELHHFNLPVTEMLAREVVRLPLYPELKDDEVDYAINKCNEFFQK